MSKYGFAFLIFVSAFSHLSGQTSEAVRLSLPAREGLVKSVAFSQDQRYAATAGDDESVRIWDLETGLEYREFNRLGGVVDRVLFEPDGRKVLAAALGHLLSLNVETGEVSRVELPRDEKALDPGSINGLALSRDGQLLLVGHRTGEVRGFNLSNSPPKLIFSGTRKQSLEGNVESVALSNDGRYGLSGGWDKVTTLWDLKTGAMVRQFKGQNVDIHSVAFSPDGSKVVTSGRENFARVWETSTGKEISHLDHKCQISSAIFLIGGAEVVTGDLCGRLRVWDVSNGTEVSSFKAPDDAKGVYSLTLSADGKYLLAGHDGVSTLWDAHSKVLLQRLGGRTQNVYRVAATPDAGLIMTSGINSTELWDTAAGRKVSQFQGGNGALSPNGKFLATEAKTQNSPKVTVWDIATARPAFEFEGVSAVTNGIDFSPDSGLLLTAEFKPAKVTVRELSSGKSICELPQQNLNLAVFSPSGKEVLAVGFDGVANLWAIQGCQLIQRFSEERVVGTSGSVSSDGRIIVTSGIQGVRVWRVTDGQPIRDFDVKNAQSVSISPDGKKILTGDIYAVGRVLDIATGSAVRLAGHSREIFSVNFLLDGRFALTGSWDGSARIWNVTDGGELAALTSFDDGTWAVTDPAFRYDASDPDRAGGLHWVNGHEIIPLGQLKSRFFTPHLLTKIIGGEDVRSITDLIKLPKPPQIDVSAAGITVPSIKVNLTEADLYLQSGHSSAVVAVAFSLDGRFVLTGSRDYTARLWDASSCRELRAFRGHGSSPYWDGLDNMEGGVVAVAFSPNGQFILTACDREAWLWETFSGRLVRKFRGHKGSVEAIAFSKDGRLVLTGGLDDTARLWEVATGQQIHLFRSDKKDIRRGPFSGIKAVAFSPDNQAVFAWSYYSQNMVSRIWSLSSPLELPAKEQRYAASGFTADVSPDLNFLVTEDLGKVAHLWNTSTGAEVRAFQGHQKALGALRFSPDGQFLLTGSGDKTARLWNTTTGQEIRTFNGHKSTVMAVAFSSDGRFVLTGSSDNTARLWDLSTGRELRVFGSQEKWKNEAVFSRDGHILLSSSDYKSSNLWDVSAGSKLFGADENAGLPMALSSDGKLLLTGSPDNSARLWDISTRKELGVLRGHTKRVTTATFSLDGKFILTGGRDDTARLWDVSTLKELHVLNVPLAPDDAAAPGAPLLAGISTVALSPDGRYALTGSRFNLPRLWDVATGRELRTFRGSHEHDETLEKDVKAVAFSPNGRFVVAASGVTVRLWETDTGQELRIFNDLGPARAVTFSPDGRFVLAGSEDTSVRLWDAQSGQQLRAFRGHDGAVTSVVISPNDRFVLTASEDHTSRLWDAVTGNLMAILSPCLTCTKPGWVVVDPKGHYDAPDPDDAPSLYWRVGGYRTVGLSQLRRGFYEPGLLRKIMSGEPLRPVAGLSRIAHLPPLAKAEIVGGPDRPELVVTLTDLDPSGYGPITVKIDNRPFQAPDLGTVHAGDSVVMHLDLSGANFAEGQNEIRVSAASSDGLIDGDEAIAVSTVSPRSRGTEPNRALAQPSAPGCGGQFFGVFIGTGKFPFAQSLFLRYPEADAQALAEAVREGAEQLCGKQNVHIFTLTTDQIDPKLHPTRDNIRRVFEIVAMDSKRDDLLILFMAGHGASPKNDPNSYFYFTQDAHDIDLERADSLRQQNTVSTEDLKEWLPNTHLPNRQIVILDTCAAGAAAVQLSQLVRTRSEADDRQKAADNFRHDTGAYFLYGSATDRVSYESDRFHHGLLTYALLQAMQNEPPLVDGGRLDVTSWFQAAVKEVQLDAAKISREQKPQISTPTIQGGVPIGFFPKDLREKLKLPGPGKEILRLTYCFEEPENRIDRRGWLPLVRSELRKLAGSTAKGTAGDVTYNDEALDATSDALMAQITYRGETGGPVHVAVRLLQGNSEFAAETMVLDGADLPNAPETIARRIIQLGSGKKPSK